MPKSISPKKLAANRANARKSTGPRTPQGKANTSRNATKHAFKSRTYHCTPAEQPAFDTLKEELLREIQPLGPIENEHFAHFLLNAWNLRRLESYESNLLAPDPANPLRNPFTDPATQHGLAILNRYRADLKRELTRSAREIERLQTQRAALVLAHPATAITVTAASPCADPLKLAGQTQSANRTFEQADKRNLTPNFYECPSVSQRLLPTVRSLNPSRLSTNQTHAVLQLANLHTLSRDSSLPQKPEITFRTSVEPNPAPMKK